MEKKTPPTTRFKNRLNNQSYEIFSRSPKVIQLEKFSLFIFNSFHLDSIQKGQPVQLVNYV